VCGVVGWRGGVGRRGDRVSLLVRNFSKFTNRVGIRRIFGRFGEISDVYIPRFFFKSSSTSFSLRLLHFCFVSGSVFFFGVGGGERDYSQTNHQTLFMLKKHIKLYPDSRHSHSRLSPFLCAACVRTPCVCPSEISTRENQKGLRSLNLFNTRTRRLPLLKWKA